jgi:hypothetical protein
MNQHIPRIIELTLAGHSRVSIAQQLGIDATRIWQIRQTPEYRTLYDQALGDTMDEVRDNFKIRARDAADRIYRLSQQAQSEKVQLAASQDVLDRGGLKPKMEVEVNNIVRLGRDVLELFARTALELGTRSTPPLLARVIDSECVLPDQERSWTEQARESLASGAG